METFSVCQPAFPLVRLFPLPSPRPALCGNWHINDTNLLVVKVILATIIRAMIVTCVLGSVLPDGDRVQHQPDQEVSLGQPEKVFGPGLRRHQRDRRPTLPSGMFC